MRKGPNPRSITDAERPWIEAWSPKLHLRLMELIAERHDWQMAFCVAGYVAARKAGHASAAVTSQATRAKYRKILAELNAEGLSPNWASGEQPPLSRAS